MRRAATVHILLIALACVGLFLAGLRVVRRRPEAAALPLALTACLAGAGMAVGHRRRRERLTAADAAGRRAAELAVRARELETRLRLATAERQHAEAILHSISDAVLVTGPYDEVVLANESAARTFAFDLSRAAHVPVDSLVRDPRIVRLIRDMREGRPGRGRRIFEHQVEAAGAKKTFKVTLSAVPEPGSDPTAHPPVGQGSSGTSASVADSIGTAGERPDARTGGVVVVLHDVSREKDVSEMKNDFVSMVSHELRTPLASIRAYVEMLIDGEAVDERTTREFYDVIQNEANRLGRLIDNILSISRIEAGLAKVDMQPQGLTGVIHEALEVVAPQAAQKQVRVATHLAAAPHQVRVDRDMLYQAVLNLLSNAIKFTPEGGTVTVCTSVDESAGKLVTRVSDTGVGIDPKELPFVFDKFYRADPGNRGATGTGLGLSLVKHIVETVHGGRISVESHPGRGSCFGFELDLVEG